jgi:uncharacterized protein YbbC (DUF1343 family)
MQLYRMKNIIIGTLFFIGILVSIHGIAQQKTIIPAAARLNEYLPLIKNKTIAIFANHTSTIGNTNLVDTLAKLGVKIKVVFGPEHGFRGNADAGEKIDSYIDKTTGLPVISLYGKKRMPSTEDLANVEVMLFDIQDVGVRFYTFISSLEEYMQSAIDNDIPLIILDRPNPNGHYIDGPVLDKKYKSFIGMQAIPVVYGMTMGEYAKMLYGEKLVYREILPNAKYAAPKFTLTVIPCANYTHKTMYVLPVKPSPNLPNIQSVYWYPSTCFFEGTVLSEGRGTDKPFMLFGHPSLPKNLIKFTPKSKPGATAPKLKDEVCYGWDVSGTPQQVLKKVNNRLQLNYLLQAYKLFPDKENFFIKPKSGRPEEYFFTKLAGNIELMEQIKKGMSEVVIRKTWEPSLQNFKNIRKKYLLYSDFY